MDNLTHTLVGLSAAKAGLERLSFGATAVCLVAANSPDSDIVAVAGGRWFYLEHHRGITHSVVGTLALALFVPLLFYACERAVARLRRRPPRARLKGLLVASLAVSATHPLLDWTNNYGLRPWLPWSGEWYYGDLVFIVDPWLWLALGGACFLATARTRWRVAAWCAFALALSSAVVIALPRAGVTHAKLVAALWLAGVVAFAAARVLRPRLTGSRAAPAAALAFVLAYWGALAVVRSRAVIEAAETARAVAARGGESLLGVAAMPTPADPTGWLVVFETDRAHYRHELSLTDEGAARAPERFPKLEGAEAELVERARREHEGARVFLGFARFPAARLTERGCAAETVLQLADLRFTRPGASNRRGGSFALEIPVNSKP
ncbi:MAG TPA: metal-dependent hydrolase [Pyrinomonadaceae bacterium]|nr:metal-dependent hydrolase [Pyrinomonadaceae bacterium]